MLLQDLLDLQARLQEKMDHPMGRGIDSVPLHSLAMIREVTELLDELPSKPWHMIQKETCRKQLGFEVVDILMFYLNIVNELGFTEEDLLKFHSIKLKDAYRRFTNVH